MFNSRLASKLSEAYSNGDFGTAFGGNHSNTYSNNTFNNFAGDENLLTNNIGSGIINTYNGNHEGQQQQMRFNEIASQVMQEQHAMNPIQRPNQSLINFANTLSHPSNNNSYLPYVANSQQMGDNDYAVSPVTKSQINDPSASQQMVYDYMPYSMERKYRNGELTNGLNKNTTMLIGVICVIGFMMFMLVQLYMSQKRVEYLVTLYRDIPINSPYYVADRFKNLTYDGK